MNKITIDLDKMESKLMTMFGSPNTILDYIKKCEIKYEVSELDKLFTGAPVMVNYAEKGFFLTKFLDWNEGKAVCADGLHYPQGKLRLPTVDEAPMNVWLTPWRKMPEELKKLRTLVRYSSGDLIAESDVGWGLKWNIVNQVMILGDS